MKTYRVTIASYQYRTIDIEAKSEKEAEEIAQSRIEDDENEFINYYCSYPYEWDSYVVEDTAYEVDEHGHMIE